MCSAMFVGLGVNSIKVTGGEPTVRADLPTLVRMFREVGPDLDISITTNGVLLDRLAAPLGRGRRRPRDGVVRLAARAPVRRDDQARRTRQGPARGCEAAEAAGLTPIKINCRRDRRHERRRGRGVRPTGPRDRLRGPVHRVHAAGRRACVGARQGRAGSDDPGTIGAVYPLRSTAPDGEPATTFGFADGAPGCDRGHPQRHRAVLRYMQPHARDRRGAVPQLPVRPGGDRSARTPIRDGASDDDLEGLIRDAMWGKWSGHRINHADFVQPARSMSMIGG